MQVQCCVCQRVRHGDKWQEAQERELRNRPISHTYCRRCANEFICEIVKGSYAEGRFFATS